MKRTFIFILLLISFLPLFAQKYVGTMKVGSYTRTNVVVEVINNGQSISGTIYKVKFSRFMPVTVDVDIKGLRSTKGKNGQIFVSGNNIIPEVKGKQYEKYIVTKFNGVISGDNIKFTTDFGNKSMSYIGTKIK